GLGFWRLWVSSDTFQTTSYQSNLQAIPRSRFAIAPYQSNLQAIADYTSPTGELALMNNQTISSHF
ncbi:hypothetical protein QHH11_27110, partial [Aphanizomenon sp. PH219]|nr:hypothetical protein [Aphanizomenon sp. PH219]